MFDDDMTVLDEIEELKKKRSRTLRSVLNKEKLDDFELDELFSQS